MKAKIYHNPRCSKSRATLALLQARGVDLEVVDYLASPPSRAVLESLVRKLGLPVRALVRTNEPEFRELGGASLTTDGELLDLVATHPRLLQRPIVDTGKAARIGRPPEQVLELFE
jgi:arsenate reductase (glutaredoxin)